MIVTRRVFDLARIVTPRGRRGWRYRVVNGTFFNPATPYEVVAALELARQRQVRIRIRYGITEAIAKPERVRSSYWLRYGGYSNPCDFIVGYVTQSPRPPHYPMLAAPNDPTHGEPIMDEQIVAIWPAHPRDDSGIFYKHPGYGMLPVE